MADADTTAAPDAGTDEAPAKKTPAKKAAPAKSRSTGARRRGSTSPRGSLARAATSATQGKKLVLLGTIGTGALAIVAAYRSPNAKREPFRIAVGVFIIGVLLLALAEVNPRLASGFAMLMLTTAAFVVGGDAWRGIASVTRVTGESEPTALRNVPTTPAPIGR